jgi:hypothetical protein
VSASSFGPKKELLHLPLRSRFHFRLTKRTQQPTEKRKNTHTITSAQSELEVRFRSQAAPRNIMADRRVCDMCVLCGALLAASKSKESDVVVSFSFQTKSSIAVLLVVVCVVGWSEMQCV